MKLVSLETYVKGPICLVRAKTDDGAEGWGQMAPYNADISAMVFHRQVAPHALGRELPPPSPLPSRSAGSTLSALRRRSEEDSPMKGEGMLGFTDSILEAEHKFPGSYNCRALGGLDTALWDLWGKKEGKPVWALLGGKPGPRPVYGSSMRRDIKPEEEAERLAKLKAEQGYEAFKIRVGRNLGHDQDEWPGRTEALLPAVRKALGPAVKLLADGNSCYSPAKAIEVGRLMQEQGYIHFEEPCPYWELDWTRQVREALDIDVAGGEQDWDMKHWEKMTALPCVDIVQPDIGYVGGLSRALKVASLAEARGLPCVPHSANLSWITLFTLHMMAAIPNSGPYVESSIEPCPWAEFYEPMLKVKDGLLQIPEGPGWGVTVDPLWLKGAEMVVTSA